MKNKKGALELSISTIVIVVIAVTLLTLSLVFIRGMFGKITTLSDKAFLQAESQINLAVHDDILTVDQKMSVKQGKAQTATIFIQNDGVTSTGDKFQICLGIIGCNYILEDANEANPGTLKIRAGSGSALTIPEGKEKSVLMLIEASDNAKIGTSFVHIRVTQPGQTQPYAESDFVVEVEPSTGWFG